MPHVDSGRLVFLDESGAHLSLTRLYARAVQGERVYDRVPQGAWQMTTMISAVRSDGVFAPFVFEGATDTAAFVTYVQQVLVPELQSGDVVIMDNLAPHKAAAVEQAVRAAGAEVQYLPAYSPDLNPIEKLWSKVKAWLRKRGARTTGALYEAIAEALRRVTPADCQGFFQACGYAVHATPMCKPP
jgi:transposase